MIVTLHTNINSLHKSYGLISVTHYKISYVSHQLLYVAVPIFMILTGCGLLSRLVSDCRELEPDSLMNVINAIKCLYLSMKKHILKTLVIIISWGTLFECANMLIRDEKIGVERFLSDIARGTTWSHMWYLNQLFIVYLFLPIISIAIVKLNRWCMLITGTILIVLCSVAPFISNWIELDTSLFLDRSMMFFIYVLLGYYIDNLKKPKRKAWIFIVAIISVLSAMGIIFYTLSGSEIIVLENNPLTLLLACSIVLEAKMLVGNNSVTPFVEGLSKCCLGIYIIHPVFIHVMGIIKINPQLTVPYLLIPGVSMVIFGISALVIAQIRRIKILNLFV